METKSRMEFPFGQFPQLDSAIGYGSSFLSTKNDTTRFIPSMPDFILVVPDEYDIKEWHIENSKLNPSHYGSLLSVKRQTELQNKMLPSVLFFPFADIKFKSTNGSSVSEEKRICKYLVIKKGDLANDMLTWSEMYVAPRLHKPCIVFTAENNSISSDSLFNFCHDEKNHLSNMKLPNSSKSVNANLINVSNAMRTSMLLSGSHFGFRDLVRSSIGLSYAGDIRNHFVDDASRIRQSMQNNFLPYLHLYLPALKHIRETWLLRLEEGDQDILTGRYMPAQYQLSPTRSPTVPDTPRDHASINIDNPEIPANAGAFAESKKVFAEKFSLEFINAEDEKLLEEIVASTKTSLKNYMAENYTARVTSLVRGIPIPTDLEDANRLLKSKKLDMAQSFTSESHCSLFHALPDSLQAHSISVSAKARLLRIFNPLAMIDSRRDREILGGPLPWERVCVDSAVRNLVRKSARQAAFKGIACAGATKATLYSLQKLCGHLVLSNV